MLQKPWVKIFIWFMAIFFFFLTSGVIISIFKPGPSEAEAMQFMTGMMSAMENSMMGVAMNLESNGSLNAIMGLSLVIAIPIMIVSIVVGILIRLKSQEE
jgi:Kef-type K+ transport system membrane component KefB